MTLGECIARLFDIVIEIQSRYASVGETGAIAVAIPPSLYSQIDDVVADVPCGYHVTPEGYAALRATRGGEELVS
jgi:hypothetical protein